MIHKAALRAMVAGCLLMGMGSGPALGGPGQAEALVEKIEKAFSDTVAMKARFTQKVENKKFNDLRHASGTLAILKPSMMRWEYAEPSELLIVADGEKLWYYDKAANSVSSEPLQGYMGPRSPLLFLAGKEPLSKVFQVSVVDDGTGQPTASLKLVPREPVNGLKGVLLKVETGSYIIREVIMVDFLGNRNSVSFSGVETAAALDKSMFKFTPPAGVDVQPAAKAPGL
ncbi:MAG: outer membrane lipoprotein chaperone LolA [Nitrospinota bacterium]|nr:outer membrane lipoprotein chaperone LolA [Nitrospinota bacterium]